MVSNKIFLERCKSKQSNNTSSGLNVELKGNRKLLPLDGVSKVISLMEQYTEEREKCNKIRLTCQVNTICSNVLFNRISEVVKYEGSKDVVFLNYGIGGSAPFGGDQLCKTTGGTTYKPASMDFWSGSTIAWQSIDGDVITQQADTPISQIVSDSITTCAPISGKVTHITNAIRDTELSRNDKEDGSGEHFVYHCGLDILNNHLIRSNTFKCICRLPEDFNNPEYTAFNTIADLMRDNSGNKVIEKVYFPADSGVADGVKLLSLHTYLYDDILSFKRAKKERLIEKYNGWFGFENKSKIKTYADFANKDPKDLRIERPIMYMSGGDFVEMYPGHDLYSFVPKYNKYRNRMEKNWNYCITYPSSSTTNGFDDIIETNGGINSLKAIYFDENTRADSGAIQLVIYSKSMHGLKHGDRVNIYSTIDIEQYWIEDENGNRISDYYDTEDEVSSLKASLELKYNNLSIKNKKKTTTTKIIDNAEVDEIADKFIFTVFNQGVQISSNWVKITNEEYFITDVNGEKNKKFTMTSESPNVYRDDNHNRYYVVGRGDNRYVNVDPNAQNISYKKVVNGIECDYYVRIFSRLPNFRFSSADTSSEYAVYNKESGETPLEIYQKPGYDFESHVSRLAFSKNIYGDEIGEIVFTDDIDLSNIHDNLGRPLSEVFLTIVKNNRGYKEWYGFDYKDDSWKPGNISADTVEFSHCFGRITCGLELSDESIDDPNTNNIKIITNVREEFRVGYPCGSINPGRHVENLRNQEISFYDDSHYYGDLCCYDNFNAIEQSIQPFLHRFNTAQREAIDSKSESFFSGFNYDEIKYDDYDSGGGFIIDILKESGCNSKPEGYYYIPHYRIPVKSFGKINTIMPEFLTIMSIVRGEDNTAIITTLEYHFLTPGDKSIIYDQENNKYYYLTTIPGEKDNDRVFTCNIYDENGNHADGIDGNNIGDYKLFKIDNLGVPSYAHLLKDGSCRYIWRDIVNNGSMDSEDSLEVYPFTNGAFYINKKIDLFLRRQDPYNNYGLYAEEDIDVDGVAPPIEGKNDYFSEEEIKC